MLVTAKDNDVGMKESYSEFEAADLRKRMWRRGASVREQCDMYGALCRMAEKRGALEGWWRLAPRTNRVVVVVKGPEWTGDVGGSVGVCLSACLTFFLLWEAERKTGKRAQLGVSESEERRCEKAEMRCFPRLRSQPGSVARPNLPMLPLPL